ncbi:hypothetical protein DMUE_1265 [Dictyocoela muelleri]|nr:hypothetical protein DMUE_1265 [Dictyocoela muelleri]
MKQRVNQNDRNNIVRMNERGTKISNISKMLNIPRTTVSSIFKKFIETGISSASKTGGDKKSKLCLADKNRLVEIVNNQPDLTLSEIKVKMSALNLVVSESTIARNLRNLHYTLKKIINVHVRRNKREALLERKNYAIWFNDLSKYLIDREIIF